MTLHVHKLAGCAPKPLAHYLKALAILRLVSEQRDASARGFWRDEAFHLVTQLSRDELERFFLDRYEPTPILSPWNAGSGFYYDDDPALSAMERSTAPRLARFRRGIAAARAMCAPLADALARLKRAEESAKANGKQDERSSAAVKLAKAEKDRLKDALLVACRRSWREGLLEWFDAALALDTSGDPMWPALLGSGGNDGRLDFTNNAMQHLTTLFDCVGATGAATASAHALLGAALFAEPSAGLSSRPVGQFFPGSAGGDNMGSGFSGAAMVNPWDFVLMLEGTVVFASSIVRAADAAELPIAAAPFAVRAIGSGYGSSATADEGPRGEQWVPVWTNPATYREVRSLFSEGRIRVGRTTSTRAIDAARGLARLGAARGVSHFERFGYMERNGQANLAVPLGRWAVASQPHEELLDDVESWVGRLRGLARDGAPQSIASAARLVDEAMLSVCRAGTEVGHWQRLLIALGNAEGALIRSPNRAADLAPIPRLRPGWIAAAGDGSTEWRLAIALASLRVTLSHQGREITTSARAHWVPLDRAARSPARFAVDSNGLANDRDVVCHGDDLERDCIMLVRRRIQLAPSLAGRHLALHATRGAEASLADLSDFLAGRTDDARILALARPLMAIEWSQGAPPSNDAHAAAPIDAAHAIVRLAFSSEPIARGHERVAIALDAEPITRLAAGDLPGAIAICLRRLRASGFSPVVHVVAGHPRYARRLAASLAFPIRRGDHRRCAALITKPTEWEDSDHAD